MNRDKWEIAQTQFVSSILRLAQFCTRLFNHTLSSGYVRVVQLPKRVTVSLRSKLVTTRVITGGKSKNVTPPCSPELGAPIYRWV